MIELTTVGVLKAAVEAYAKRELQAQNPRPPQGDSLCSYTMNCVIGAGMKAAGYRNFIDIIPNLPLFQLYRRQYVSIDGNVCADIINSGFLSPITPQLLLLMDLQNSHDSWLCDHQKGQFLKSMEHELAFIQKLKEINSCILDKGKQAVYPDIISNMEMACIEKIKNFVAGFNTAAEPPPSKPPIAVPFDVKGALKKLEQKKLAVEVKELEPA